jgi:hypothetical protein
MTVNPVSLNNDLCRKIGNSIANFTLRNDFYQREFLTIDLDIETKLRMQFFAVAICHQTHVLHHPDMNMWGWDYLEYAFVEIAKNKPGLIDPNYLSKLSVEKLKNELRPYFSKDGNPENCTLDRLDERAKLMIDASGFIVRNFDGNISEIIAASDQMLVNGGKGLYENLRNMEAYADPMQKKTTFLIKLLEESESLKIKDPEHFIPIMDYHMQRVLLRLGCVEIKDEQLRQDLTERKPMKSDKEVRSACIEAFKIIAGISGHPVTKMNDFFWSLGRSCCNETTLCSDKVCSKNPCTLSQIVKIEHHNSCIFEKACMGYTDEKYRKLWQPLVDTHYY